MVTPFLVLARIFLKMWTFRENRYVVYMLLCTQFAQFILHYLHYFIKLSVPHAVRNTTNE